MPNQTEDASADQIPDDPEELVAEYRQAQEEISAIVDKQFEIHQAAGGRLVEIPDSEGSSIWMPPFGEEDLPLSGAEEVAMKALNKLEQKLEEKRQYRELIATKAAVNGVELPRRGRKAAPDEEQAKETTERNVFRRKGDYWNVRYAGKASLQLKDSTGMQYIGYLLGHPGEKFRTPLELERVVKRPEVESNPRYSVMTKAQLDEEGLSIQRPVHQKFDRATFEALKACH